VKLWHREANLSEMPRTVALSRNQGTIPIAKIAISI
jgi:hypothetical protein